MKTWASSQVKQSVLEFHHPTVSFFVEHSCPSWPYTFASPESVETQYASSKISRWRDTLNPVWEADAERDRATTVCEKEKVGGWREERDKEAWIEESPKPPPFNVLTRF
jgi:hypothetical protein